MDDVRFEVRDFCEPVRVLLNGRDLIEHVREQELPLARQEGSPSIAGGYLGVVPYVLHRSLVGSTGKISVLGCECGVHECWPLNMQVTTTDRMVIWSDFRQPYRKNWTYNLRFTFALGAYEAELERLTRYRSPWELPPARFGGWPGDKLDATSFPGAFYVDEPERPLAAYTELASLQDARHVREIVRDSTVPAVLRAAALRALPARQLAREPAVLELLDSTDEWTRLLVLFKLRESPVARAIPRLLEILADSAELWDGADNYVSIYPLADQAGLALAANPLNAPQRRKFGAWVAKRRMGLHADNYTERRTAAFFFAALGEPGIVEILKELANVHDPPCQEVLDLLREMESA